MRQTEREETLGAIGEDLFAIALDQPFRFPATFTFVLRAFTTLEVRWINQPIYRCIRGHFKSIKQQNDRFTSL